MTTSDQDVVAALSHRIAQRIGEPRYRLWFERSTKFTWHDDQLLVGVPNRFYQEWLETTFAESVRGAASEVLARPMQVRFAIDPELFQAARVEQAAVSSKHAAKPGRHVEPHPREPSPDDDQHSTAAPRRRGAASSSPEAAQTRLNAAVVQKRTRRWHRLNEFVVGACNRLAHAAATSVVEAPGEFANPLVIHGPVGTGKTHLLEGIYAELRKSLPRNRHCFVTAEGFTNQFLHAMSQGKLGAFRKKYRDCDSLLIDDLNFLAKKKATSEEFLHTLDSLQNAGTQVVITCDCHPKYADRFSRELTDRLLGGACWGLLPPDLDTRLQILKMKALQAAAPMAENVLRLMAENLRGNARELEGALHSLRHMSRVIAKPIDLILAREVLADLLRHSVRMVPLTRVNEAVCKALLLDTQSLQSKQRSWSVSHPRMLAMYLARKHTSAAYSEIGEFFGGRNHSTVVAAEKKVRQWLEGNEELAAGSRKLPVREVLELAERELLR